MIFAGCSTVAVQPIHTGEGLPIEAPADAFGLYVPAPWVWTTLAELRLCLMEHAAVGGTHQLNPEVPGSGRISVPIRPTAWELDGGSALASHGSTRSPAIAGPQGYYRPGGGESDRNVAEAGPSVFRTSPTDLCSRSSIEVVESR